ncbi:MAG: L-serine ammonia-lyase [Gemmatimonadota bacterium]|nr:L-serine ammonia-lyase [Gemmatimonadota bacterium]
MQKKPLRSIREIYRAGTGPSSSHTMAPRRAAELFLKGHGKGAAKYRVTLYGSLASTGLGHLTDAAIKEVLQESLCEFIWHEDAENLLHPNGILLEGFGANGEPVGKWLVFSTGGGELVDETGVVESHEPVEYPFRSMAELLDYTAGHGKPLWSVVEEIESDLWPWLDSIWHIMRNTITRGIETEGVLPGGLDVPRKAASYLTRTCHMNGALSDIGRISAYALAVSEENAAGGEVVTAPTCGAAGVLPGLLYYMAELPGVSSGKILKALATAGITGALVKANASVSGAEVGCQGEIGTASSMAAAAAAQILGGSPHQIEYAAEMAMEHSLGLTCDPVQGLVQIPCIERNAAGAARAFNCAGYALLGDGRHRISFDEVVETMLRTGIDMSSAYRETAKGGLATLEK